MEELKLLIDLHKDSGRLGPGSRETTEKAFNLTGLSSSRNYKAADIGCGTGAQTFDLVEMSECSITAVDLFQIFLDKIENNKLYEKYSDRIRTVCCSMDNLPFEDNELDLIWSEGAVYNIGFENGIKKWRKFLKPDGILAVTEISWLTESRPAELENYWNKAYPEIATAEVKKNQLETAGYRVIADFVLPDSCWLDNYYLPLEKKFHSFLGSHDNSKTAAALINDEIDEIEMYRKYSTCYGYVFYIAAKKG